MTENSNQSSEPKLRLLKTVSLVGMMGSGKTAIGRSLAARLGVDLLDSDSELEIAANATVAEVFARDGETFFRAREAEIIERLLDGPPGVLSTGGGAFLAQRNRDAMSQKGVSVWLDADLELLWSRVKHKTTRPLLHTADPYATLSEILENRGPIYALADLRVVGDPTYSIEHMTDQVVAALRARPDILA